MAIDFEAEAERVMGLFQAGTLTEERDAIADVLRHTFEAGTREAEFSVRFTQEWYAVRFRRLRDLLKEHPAIWRTAACIMANGTGDVHEPPTYAQQLNLMRFRAEKAEKERDELRAVLEGNDP